MAGRELSAMILTKPVGSRRGALFELGNGL